MWKVLNFAVEISCFFIRPWLLAVAKRPPIKCLPEVRPDFSIRYLANSFPNFYRGRGRCEVWHQFLIPLVLEPPSFLKEAIYLKSTCETDSVSVDGFHRAFTNWVKFGPRTPEIRPKIGPP